MRKVGTADGNRCEQKAGAKYEDPAEDRKACAEGLCCGSADKFLRDGSFITIELCKKTDVREVDYWPPFPAGSLSTPAAEKWRFQCISAAQKLMASATVALSAVYMMH